MHKQICLNEKRILLPLRLEGLEVAKEQRRKKWLLDEMGRRADDPERIAERFWSKVDVSGEDDCWEWKASKNHSGYGQLMMKHLGRPIGSHVLSLIILGVEIPKGNKVCHRCDNPGCVNPKHLFVGTQRDNAEDMVKKGRSAKGERHSQSKLKNGQIFKIRDLISRGISDRKIGIMFGVGRKCISKIRLKKAWTHI